MLYSTLFPKPQKQGREYDSVNATYLLNGGFIHQTMAGVYSYLPLGMRVLTKIEQIVRSEMDKIGQEVLMPSIVPTKNWEDTDRLEVVDVLFKVMGANQVSRERNDAEYILNPTHEEVITPLAKQFTASYKDLPFALFQIQTKFRNEPRAKSGILRGREFRMKDLYSFHTSEEDLLDYYDNVAKPAYIKTFKRLGLGESTVIALASGGDFTDKYSHEFQTLCETGEDTLYYDKEEDVYYNKEVVKDLDNPKYETVKAAEVGNIFPLNTKFSDALDFTYTDEKGERKKVYMGCYGIGTSRVMGVLVEKFHDDRGIIWPMQVAPYHVHLVALDLTDDAVKKRAFALCEQLEKEGIEVLFDEREDIRPGAKFADADLIGIPVRLVISKRTEDKVEWKKRDEKDAKIMSSEEALQNIKKLSS